MRVALLSLSSKKKINKFWTNKNHIWIKNNIIKTILMLSLNKREEI